MAKRCVASGLAELDPPTCWDLCVNGSLQAIPRRELIDPVVRILASREDRFSTKKAASTGVVDAARE